MTGFCSFDWPQLSRSVGPCLRPGGDSLTEKALDLCRLPPGARIADIGCGAGGTLAYLAGAGSYDLVGIDPSEMLLGEAALRLGGARLVMGRAEVLPFEGDSFDALFCECVLSVLDDRMAALDEFARVVKDGGALVISDVFRKGEHGRGGQTDGLLTREELLDLVSGRGFNLLLWEAHDRLLREFAVRMILAGECLPDSWGGGRNRKEGNTDGPAISYFLLVARKSGGSSGREAVTPL